MDFSCEHLYAWALDSRRLHMTSWKPWTEGKEAESTSLLPSTDTGSAPLCAWHCVRRVPGGKTLGAGGLPFPRLWPYMFAVYWCRRTVYTIWTTWSRPCRRCSFTSSPSRSCSWGHSLQPPWSRARASRTSTTSGWYTCFIFRGAGRHLSG